MHFKSTLYSNSLLLGVKSVPKPSDIFNYGPVHRLLYETTCNGDRIKNIQVTKQNVDDILGNITYVIYICIYDMIYILHVLNRTSLLKQDCKIHIQRLLRCISVHAFIICWLVYGNLDILEAHQL